MPYQVIAPDIKLKSIVKQYLVINDLAFIEGMVFLPNGGNFIVFNRGVSGYSQLHNGDNFEIPASYSMSIKTSKAKKVIFTLDSTILASTPIILVELLPLGFYKLFAEDASTLNKQYLLMDKSLQEQYLSKLYSFDSIEEEIEYLNSALIELYNSYNHKQFDIEEALAKIEECHFEITIEELALECGCSRRTLERKFKKYIGITPKSYIFISKFCKTILEYIEEGKSLREMEYLYSDNAHLNKVFQKIVGCVPSKMFSDVARLRFIKVKK